MASVTGDLHIVLPLKLPAVDIQDNGQRLVIMYPGNVGGGDIRFVISFASVKELQQFVVNLVEQVNIDDYIVERAEALGLINPEKTPY